VGGSDVEEYVYKVGMTMMTAIDTVSLSIVMIIAAVIT